MSRTTQLRSCKGGTMVGDVWEIKVYNTYENQLGLNVLHFQSIASNGTDPSALFVAKRASTVFAPLYIALLNNLATFYGVTAQRLAPTKQAWDYDRKDTDVGTGGADPMPKQVAGFFYKRSLTSDRHGRGRVYVPFPAKQNEDAGESQPNAAYMTALTALANQYKNGFTVTEGGTTEVMAPYIYNRVTGATIRVTYCQSVKKWATQRRRGDFGRINTMPF